MLGKNMIYNEHDYEAIKILNDFLPDKIFDAHMHLYDTDFAPSLKGGIISQGLTFKNI